MIICPRCGYQAPDGSPWCPRCGYGCPYPIQYQQQLPQQMPVPYQPQPIPAQYDVVDIPPQPDPGQQKPPKKKKKKKKLHGCIIAILAFLGVIILGFVAIVIAAIVDPSTSDITKTPTLSYDELMDTAVAQAQQYHNETSTVWALSATPTYTVTPIPPTAPPIPSNTPAPTDTPIPLPAGAQYYTVREGENCWSIARDHGISEYELLQANGMSSCNIGIDEQIIIPAAAAVSYIPAQTYTDNSYVQPNTGIRGSVAQDTSTNNCAVKGSKTGKYHCKNSPNYDTMKEYTCFSSQAAAEAAGYVMSGNQGGWCAQ